MSKNTTLKQSVEEVLTRSINDPNQIRHFQHREHLKFKNVELYALNLWATTKESTVEIRWEMEAEKAKFRVNGGHGKAYNLAQANLIDVIEKDIRSVLALQ